MASAQPRWRLLLHQPAEGAWNMAVDEAILQSYVDAASPMPPTLRLYGWRPPALSLGKAQAAALSHDPRYLRREGIDLVRRPTGGMAVLHEHERTYAVIGSLAELPFGSSVLENYRRVAQALREAMSRLGVAVEAAPESRPARERGAMQRGPACFDLASAYEIAVGGRKLIGSAQLRRRMAFLQHGSILVDSKPERLSAALGVEASGERFTDLTRALGRRPAAEEIDAALIAAWARTFGVRMEPGELTARERAAAEALRADKYGSDSWTFSL